MSPRSVTAFAPATSANVAVGFDVLGFSFPAVGDRVTLTEREEPGVAIDACTGIPEAARIPTDPAKNTATVGLMKLMADRGLSHGFSVRIEKGIAMGSGMGGSAASSVAALVAANAFLAKPLSRGELLEYALLGETVASGTAHGDNVAPCLFGGITLVRSMSPVDIVPIPLPTGVSCVLVHPHLEVQTKHARSILKKDIALADHVRQSANLGAFVAACFRSDPDLLARCLVDVLIEPQRASLIPGFEGAKKSALAAGALGFSISGSGPSVFAWARDEQSARRIETAVREAFGGTRCDSWIAPLSMTGAQIVIGARGGAGGGSGGGSGDGT